MCTAAASSMQILLSASQIISSCQSICGPAGGRGHLTLRKTLLAQILTSQLVHQSCSWMCPFDFICMIPEQRQRI